MARSTGSTGSTGSFLETLALEPVHGWVISQHVRQIADGVLDVSQGSLHPARQRLEKHGLITTGEWGTTDTDRRARRYRPSAAGRHAPGAEREGWRRFAAGLEAVPRTTRPMHTGNAR